VNPVPVPVQTAKAFQLLDGCVAEIDRIRRVLLANIDGHRNVVELESFARAMGLESDALLRMRREGLIEFAD
jgi:hypothetical protein